MVLTAKEHAAVLARLGWLAIFNPCKPEGYYELDLTRWEERQVLLMQGFCRFRTRKADYFVPCDVLFCFLACYSKTLYKDRDNLTHRNIKNDNKKTYSTDQCDGFVVFL